MDEALLLSFPEIEHAHWWFTTRRMIVEDAIGTELPCGSRIVEVGCGTGSFLRALAARFPDANVVGIEPNEAAAHCAVRNGGAVSIGTLETLPTEIDGSVDLLVALDVLEHCLDDVTALRRARTTLSPGGRIVLTVPALPWLWGPHDELNHHFRRYTARTLARAIGDAGLEIDRMTYFNSLLLPAGALSRLVARVTGTQRLSGVDLPHPALNAFLTRVFSAEVGLLRRMDLPLGMSLLALARLPREEAT